jgi:hypothetical protein
MRSRKSEGFIPLIELFTVQDGVTRKSKKGHTPQVFPEMGRDWDVYGLIYG